MPTRWLSTLKGEVMSIDTLFFVLLLAVCGIAGYLAIPRVMRKWSVATKPADERLEYSAHMGQEVDRGPSSPAPKECERAGHRELEDTPIRQL